MVKPKKEQWVGVCAQYKEGEGSVPQTQHCHNQSLTSGHHQIQEKLEEEKEEKGLSLDPPRTHLYQKQEQQRNHHFYHNPFQSSRSHVEGEEEDQDQDQDQDSPPPSHRDQLFHLQHQHHHYLNQDPHTHQHQHHQQQQFYARLVSASPTASETPVTLPGAQPQKKRSYLPSPSIFGEPSLEYGTKMGENSSRAAVAPPSRLGMRGGGGGEIVEVQGGHIVRSTGRKDRHSKVCTAKGPRDRRVRLSAHTAIQFYDVQDRLGYDRPSKAVDWLIKKAKSAIDELAELPPWHPNVSSAAAVQPEETEANQVHQNSIMDTITQNPNTTSSFLPPSLDSDAIADTIKSFFPMGAAAQPPPPPQFHSQDLRLSLQSFQDPNFLHQQSQGLFSGTSHLGFDGSAAGWGEHHHPAAEMGRFQRMVSSSWNNAGADTTGGSGGEGGGAFMFASPPPPLQPLFGGHGQFYSQRGPLQSSHTPSIRAWMDPPSATTSSAHFHPFQSANGFASGGFSGFHIPARIHGEEEHDGISNKPSSASSDSHH